MVSVARPWLNCGYNFFGFVVLNCVLIHFVLFAVITQVNFRKEAANGVCDLTSLLPSLWFSCGIGLI